jgi:hypothetical protein
MSEQLTGRALELQVDALFDRTDHLAHDALSKHLSLVRGEQIDAEVPEQHKPTREELTQELGVVTERMWDLRDELHEVELKRAGILNALKVTRE